MSLYRCKANSTALFSANTSMRATRAVSVQRLPALGTLTHTADLQSPASQDYHYQAGTKPLFWNLPTASAGVGDLICKRNELWGNNRNMRAENVEASSGTGPTAPCPRCTGRSDTCQSHRTGHTWPLHPCDLDLASHSGGRPCLGHTWPRRSACFRRLDLRRRTRTLTEASFQCNS